jgi:KipI family sensor histidine kinase inhibitor
VAEAIPGVTSLLLAFGAPPASPDPLTQRLLAAWEQSRDAPIPEGRSIDIPVTYGGPDLVAIAERTGLDVAEVVRRHAAAEYRVFTLGSQPGFAYMGGVDPSIAIPRKAIPVLWVAAGTVVIGGMQAAVVAAAGPNGWHAVGHSEVTLFDPARELPALLAPGDRVHFRKIALAA